MKGSLLHYWHHVLFHHQRLNELTVHLPTVSTKTPGLVYVCPYRSNTLVPFWIPALLTEDGTLERTPNPSMPLIPPTFLDPEAPHGHLLGDLSLYERALLELNFTDTWDDYYAACLSLFQTVTQSTWQPMVQPLIIQTTDVPHRFNAQANFWNTLLTLNPPPAMISNLIKAGSDEAEFKTVLSQDDLQQLPGKHIGHPSQTPLNVSQRTVLTHLLELPPNSIQAVHTPPHTGSAALVQAYAASIWVKAALKKEKPPIMVVMTDHTIPTAPQHPLSAPWISTDNPNPTLFLEQCSTTLGIQIIHLNEAKTVLHQKVSDSCAALSEGLQKYQQDTQDSASLHVALQRLQNDDQELEIQFELLSDGLRYWQSELYTTTGWRQAIEWATQNRKKMRDELTARFVEKGIMGVTCLGWLEVPFLQVEKVLQDKVSEIRVRRTQLHSQLIPLCEKIAQRSNKEVEWLKWQKAQEIFITASLAAKTPESFLDQTARHQAYAWAVHYWEACWLESIQLGKTLHPFEQQAYQSPTVLIDPCFVIQEESTLPKIHTWITLDAVALSPMEAIFWLDHSERAIALGDRLLSPEQGTVLSAIDVLYCHQFDLADNEDELEELYFAGKLASATSWWQLASVASYFQSADFAAVPGTVSLALQHNDLTHKTLLTFVQSNGYTDVLVVDPHIHHVSTMPPFGYLCIKGRVESVQGGLINRLEAQQIVQWLQVNRSLLKWDQTDPTLLAIVTPFAAQKQLLQRLCQEKNCSFIAVFTLSELPKEAQYDLVIFSPTYTVLSQRPFCFDRGSFFINRLLLAAKEAFFVMGDIEAFDPQMHSPSGKLAKCLFSKEEYHLPHYHLLPQGDKGLKAMLLDLPSFYNQLQDTLVDATERFVLVTPRLSPSVVESLQFLTQIKTAVSRGVEVLLYIGDGLEEGWQDVSVQAVLQSCIEAGASVRIVHHIQASCCWTDGSVFLESLHPWLVVWNIQNNHHGLSVNQYEGEFAKELINERQIALNARTIRRFKPKTFNPIVPTTV